jgi:serine/threonine protein kinase
MVTEFVSNGCLFDILHRSENKDQLPDDFQILQIAKQIALAMIYLHSRGILHCDLKSQNVLLTDDYQVKLCDFGLARYKERFMKDNHGKIGTPHWMAPEILRGEKYEEPADVYSFGVILWEMLTI